MKMRIKILHGVLLAVLVSSSALANETTLTIQADMADVLSVQLERTTDSVIVSGDDIDSSSTFSTNEVMNFASVNPLGLDAGSLVNRSITGTNSTTGLLNSMVIDTSKKLYKANGTGTPLPTSTNNGALYFVQNALQVRSLRTGGGTTLIDVSNVGAFSAVIENQATYNFANNTTVGANAFLDKVGTLRSGGLATLNNNTPLALDFGIHVPFNQPAGNAQTTMITFTGT